jgi:hypothetical protein
MQVLEANHAAEMDALKGLVDGVQRLGVDSPRFHAGMLDQLHRQSNQLQHITALLRGDGGGGGGGGSSGGGVVGGDSSATLTRGVGAAGSPRGSKVLGEFEDLSRTILLKRDAEVSFA